MFACCAGYAGGKTGAEFEGAKKSLYAGCERIDFIFEGKKCVLVVPAKPRGDGAWVLRPAFFGAFDAADRELLKRGFYLAHCDVGNRYANPQSRREMDRFYEFMVSKRGLSRKVALEGLSRGGAFALLWANDDPSKIACVYVDNPACDIAEWPVKRRPELAAEFRRSWNLKEGEEKSFARNPFDELERLARSGAPVLMIVGDRDDIVPFEKHGKIYQDRFFDNGGALTLIVRQGGGHHPHGLASPAPIVDFIERAYEPENIDARSPQYRKFLSIKNRGGIANAFAKFAREGRGKVAFVGGSITEMHGWKELVCADLKKRFPKTRFEFVYSGIASLGTIPHAFRLRSDIPDLKTVDLLFLEGTVNDDSDGWGYDSRGDRRAIGVEGVVRQALRENPQMDIVILDFIHDGFFDVFKRGETPAIIKAHESVAEYYGLPSINLAAEIYARIQAGEFDWQKFGGLHPAPFGHRYYARAIENLFDMNPPRAELKSRALPPRYCPDALEFGHYVGVGAAKIKSGWRAEKPWKPKSQAYVRPRFRNLEILEAREAGAELEFEFEGGTVGAFVLAGDEAGVLEYSIDGAKPKKFDMYSKFSGRLFLPYVIIFGTGLGEGNHTLSLKMLEEKNPQSKGNACQIIGFGVNSER